MRANDRDIKVEMDEPALRVLGKVLGAGGLCFDMMRFRLCRTNSSHPYTTLHILASLNLEGYF